MEKKDLPKPHLAGNSDSPVSRLTRDLDALILSCRTTVAAQINSALVMLYWMVGKRLADELLDDDGRAAYGKRLVKETGIALAASHGRGFETKNLWRMMGFADAFPDQQIVATLSRQLGWSHFKEILPLKDANSRAWYARTAGEERWSVRHLRKRIEAKDYERTALATLKQGHPETSLLSPPTNKSNSSKCTTTALWSPNTGPNSHPRPNWKNACMTR